MENNIKINFENYLNKKNFSSSQKEIKEIILIILLKMDFLTNELKIGNFQI
jgi:hypothetical protein